MSNKKISQFQVVTTLNGTTYVPVIQGSPLFDAIISASNFATSLQDYNDNFYIKLDGTNSDIDVLNFNQNPQAVNLTTAQFAWAAADGTFAYGVEDGGLIQLSKELFDYYVNVDTVPLVNGDVVSIVPISGNRKAIARTNVTNAQSAKNAIGMVTVASIAVGATGRITKFGEVHDLITTLYPDGTELFVSESNAGKWATVGATPPNYTVKIGTVIVSQNGNGIVELGIQCFPKLGDLSDVNGVSSSVNKPIVRKADGVIDAINTGLDINGITPSSGTTTITGDLSVDDITSDVVSANTVNVTDLNATDVESTNGFVKTGSSNNQVLLGAGGAKNVADFQLKSEKGQANGYASLDSNGLVPSTQLPSFVDDVIEVANYAALPAVGETGKIYVTLDTNKAYRWSGSTYVYITSGAVDSVAGKTGVVTLVKSDVGLSNVDNTSDANKPISTATQTALNGKVNNTGDETIAGIKTFSSSPIVPNPTTSGQAMNKGTADGAYVGLTGNQTIAGVKTFSSSPIVPTPTNGTDAANKDYVTSSVIGAMPAATAKLEPQLAYYTRVLADLGSVKDLDRLTELYMNQLNLLPYTHFMWDGNAGYKVVDGKLVKAYSMDNAGNDGTTSSGTEPYAGGLIAPNESLKAKALIQEKSILIPSKSYLSTDKWSITFSIKQFDFVNSIINGGTILFFNERDLRYYNGSTEYVFYDVIDNNEIGKTINYTVVANGNGVMSLYKNGIYFSSLSAVSNANFNTLLSDAYGHINNCELNSISVISKALSAHEIQLQHELLRLQHPEIEGKDIGNQHWATSNYEGVVTGNGTVIPEVQDATAWAALTTPGWCYYNNDAALGAVLGKKYNWYAIAEIAKNPPADWRVPIEEDYIQLRDYLGGSTVAGGKLKALYGGFNNAFSTNESGFSAIAAGRRLSNGSFESINIYGEFATITDIGGGYRTLRLDNNNAAFNSDGENYKAGVSLRLLRNSPVGEDTKIVSTGRFSTDIDIAITAKTIPIPFGYAVEKIVIDSTNNLTGIKAMPVNSAGSQDGDLYFQNETISANTSKVFAINVNQTQFKQDAFVYVWATGNTGDGMTIDVVLKKIQ